MLKRASCVLLCTFVSPVVAWGTCGSLPAEPTLLSKSQVTTIEIAQLSSDMTPYVESYEAYKACVEDVINHVPQPQDMSEEAMESYDRQIAPLQQQIEAADADLNAALKTYNKHVITAIPVTTDN